ncbi:MAG: hypothetical protein ACLPX9_06165 [Rhodomicrobium sp.]
MFAKVERDREYIPFRQHWHTSNVLHDIYVKGVVGENHVLLASLVFRAFSFEAFLNHVGSKQYQDWKTWERGKGWKIKINKILTKRGAPDYSLEPWCTVDPLRKFRDPIAHGHDLSLEDEDLVPLDQAENLSKNELNPPHLELFSRQSAERTRSCITDIIEDIHQYVFSSPADLFFLGSSGGKVTVVNR